MNLNNSGLFSRTLRHASPVRCEEKRTIHQNPVLSLGYGERRGKADVIIIGAGAAGLSCAATLKKGGQKVLLLEARKRIGGRAFTLEHPHFDQPVEFGPEFVHGAPKELTDIMDQFQLGFTDVKDEHLYFRQRRLRAEENFWDRIAKVTARLNPDRPRDRSVREFVRHQGTKLPTDLRKIFEAYVEGFQAANLDLMGEKALALAEQSDEGELNGSALFRPTQGHAFTFHKFIAHHGLESSLRLQCAVKQIHWRPNQVRVSVMQNSRKLTYTARKVVLTVPIGVLKEKNPTSYIQLDPEIPALDQHLESVHMGHVQRITFQFTHRFWENLSPGPVSFLHAGPENFFPTWWTQMPHRSPLLVAWQGGPRAAELGAMPVQNRVDLALRTLAKISGRHKSFLKRHLMAYFTHNWSEDPYSLGAYSYTGIQTAAKPPAWIRGFANTIWIAGEGTMGGAQQGTLHGALRSGRQTAERILKMP